MEEPTNTLLPFQLPGNIGSLLFFQNINLKIKKTIILYLTAFFVFQDLFSQQVTPSANPATGYLHKSKVQKTTVSFEPRAVSKIVSIKIKVSTISRIKDCCADPAGRVAPKLILPGNAKKNVFCFRYENFLNATTNSIHQLFYGAV